MKTIKRGTTLFRVHALDKPAELGGTERQIGVIITDSEMVTSSWADEHLFFRHQKMEDDIKYRPEWEPYVPAWKGLIGELTKASNGEEEFITYDNPACEATGECPFAWLMKLVI